ncbi:MAG: hypothetical protein IKJ59_09570 [Clostridia bacterium]|nr:hypothetical protein [Clostridia bacterium]
MLRLEDSVVSNILEFLFEKFSEIVANLLEFHSPLYNLYLDFFEFAYIETFGNLTDFILNLLSVQSVDFSTKGKLFVDSFFSKLNFADTNFTDDFLFWFIGLLLFAFAVKFFFKLALEIFKSIFDFITKFI